MVNSAIASVCTVLDREFGFPVYTEPVEQGMQMPCFFVSAEKYSEKKYIGQRRRIGFSVEIIYLPSASERRRDEALQVGNRLIRLFRVLETDEADMPCFHGKFDFNLLTRGFNRGFETTDEVLKFTFDVILFAVESEENEDIIMENCTVETTERSKYGTN